ncbi:MAG: hypothetical protein AAFQ54_02265 [Pseudomonadota bacterium]
MKTGLVQRVPLTAPMLKPLEAVDSEYVIEGQKRHAPLSHMSMLMLLRRRGPGTRQFTACARAIAIGRRKRPRPRTMSRSAARPMPSAAAWDAPTRGRLSSTGAAA